MEETTKSIWNKTADEVTVKDQLIIAVAIPAVMAGGLLAVSAVAKTGEVVANKFKAFRANRKNETTEES